MKQTLGSPSERSCLLQLIVLLILTSLAFKAPTVQAQEPFSLIWTFDYSPLVSSAPNSLHVQIQNIGGTPLRILSVSIGFSWMEPNTYLSLNSTIQDISPGSSFTYTIPFQISANVLTGRYQMSTLLQYETLQASKWTTGTIVYILDVVVVGSVASYTLSVDIYDVRLYAACAVFVLIGWYLPKRLRPKAKV